MSSILSKLLSIQQELKAPKNQKNTFGGYNYRSCEDILEAVKPLCKKHGCVLTLSDEVLAVGNRVYVKAGASLIDIETGDACSNTAYAREAETKKGMDDSQITGTASSYARKYALNGLFCIDDTKDADTNEYRNTQKNAPSASYTAPEQVCCNNAAQLSTALKKEHKRSQAHKWHNRPAACA